MHEYAVIRTPLGTHVAVPRREVVKGDDVVEWRRTIDDAETTADGLNDRYSDEIAAMRRMQLSLFDD